MKYYQQLLVRQPHYSLAIWWVWIFLAYWDLLMEFTKALCSFLGSSISQRAWGWFSPWKYIKAMWKSLVFRCMLAWYVDSFVNSIRQFKCQLNVLATRHFFLDISHIAKSETRPQVSFPLHCNVLSWCQLSLGVFGLSRESFLMHSVWYNPTHPFESISTITPKSLRLHHTTTFYLAIGRIILLGWNPGK